MLNNEAPLAGKTVKRIGFGAMQLTGHRAFGPPADPSRARSVIREAVDAGVNHIDTAFYYGPAVVNELIQSALYPYPPELVIVSKLGAKRHDDGKLHEAQQPDDLRAGVKDNLRTLNLEQVPIVNLRRHNETTVPLSEQLDAMFAMQREGLIGAVGVSNITIEEYQEAKSAGDIACVQNAFSVLDRSDQELFDLCKADGVPYVPFFPLGSAFIPERSVLNLPEVHEVALRLGMTPAQVALAWLFAQAPTVLLIPGTSSPDHLKENLAVDHLTLDEEAMTVLGRLAQ